ncbi:HPP family protein [Nisaea acidiphila]|uniref:HPP family protein n=1 Tax=Nisaea acidiphila TaxID=1862145 RepID=A0A9J7AWN8_9PROT|nr:HPP family protein [Nisaea acidiphila]UUX49853.1 HPP family protein [Nisaea acidiphila]
MLKLIRKMSGAGTRPAPAEALPALICGIGAAIAIAATAGLSELFSAELMMAPFGASCFLAFAVPESPLAQPRNIVLGHLVASGVGLAILTLLGPGWPTMALAVGLAVAAMQWTGTGHAPAGADPIVVFLLRPDFGFLVTPVLAGALLIVAVALIFNNLRPGKRYPVYW